jgi:energy-coupling factor transporter ATP-binding protein EcfA2
VRSAVDTLESAVRSVGASNPVVLIDGRSGAGKTTLARALVARWPQQGRVQMVPLDDLYPGWDGLADGAEYAREHILVPHGRGMLGIWQRWDWESSQRAEAHAVDPSLPLIVEGSGLLTRNTARLGDVRVWLESPVTSRRSRALARDGDAYRPHWTQWAEQEERHLALDQPSSHATHVFAMP